MKRAVRCVLGLWLGFAGAVWAAAEDQQPSRNRNVTFLSTSDCHYKTADSKTCHNDLNHASVEAMNAIATARWPDQLGGESVSPPRGVVVLGDVIDDGDKAMPGRKISEEQNRFFLADFGLDGTDGLLKYPVFEGWGNHDGPSEGNEKNGFSFQGQLKKRNQVRKQKGLITNLSENGLHYSWDWDDVHFLQLNLYPADQQRKGVRYSPVWHDPQGSLTFLKKDLAEKVGTSGRPVILMSHCGFDTDWWTPADWEEVYEAAKPYNVILYLYGHSGTGVLQWAPKGQERKWTCINDGQTEKGFFVIQITGDRLRAAMRVKANLKVTKDPDGTLHHQWDGKWEWKWPLNKPLALGPSTPTLEKKPTKEDSPSVSPVIPVGPAEKDAAPSAKIRVNLQEKKAPVSPSLYGIFMEEISQAFDGGIYAELIRNRSFEEGVPPPGLKLVKKDDGGLKMELEKLPPDVPKEKWAMPWPWMMNCNWDPKRELIGWSLENQGGAKGEMKLTEANPMNAASARSLELTITPSTDTKGGVALVNSGYWGIHAQAGTAYALKFYLRPGDFQGEMTALLRAKDGKELARHEFGAVKPGDSWQKHTATLKASGTDPEARFVLLFRGQGTLQVDWVSLFPPTYKNRPNGLRLDLAKYLEELKPAFIRYPGGCYVEGLSFESAPDWRRMVCPPEQRPGMWGYWQYRSTDGFGYHEFLEFCEDIGADAMYVAFAGMTVHPENNWPLDKIEPVIQQTLDAIEYAIGPVDSKWGAVRAKMGHPRPFPLKYVEIGNEHPPALYGDYYAKFRRAIKAKYPEMTVVMSMYWSGLNWGAIQRAGDDKIDIVDEHAYRPSGWARTNFDYFDRYKRTPWKIYLGEYAHHHGGGDWSAAMDDSVFLMMMERNGDLVKMASYAPLFSNVHKKDWGVNLIEYDAARSFAHASYYVQKVFNENRPDVNLATTVAVEPKPDPNRPLMRGKFGLGAWNTQTEFKELRVYDDQNKLVWSDDFQTLENWETPGIGQWQVQNGVLRQTDKGKSPAMLLLKTPELKTGRVTLKARRVAGNEGFLMFFNASSIDRFLFCNYGAAGNSFSALQDRGVPEGCAFKGGPSTPGKIENDRWYDIGLVVGRNKAEMFLDGKRVSDARMEALPSFFATAGYDQKNKTVVVKATNYYRQPLRAEIELVGSESVGNRGQQITLRSDEPTDENTLENPRRIVPQEQPLSDCAKRFSVTLPPQSVNLLRIPASAQ